MPQMCNIYHPIYWPNLSIYHPTYWLKDERICTELISFWRITWRYYRWGSWNLSILLYTFYVVRNRRSNNGGFLWLLEETCSAQAKFQRNILLRLLAFRLCLHNARKLWYRTKGLLLVSSTVQVSALCITLMFNFKLYWSEKLLQTG